jgi:hypothetical protein
MSPENLLDGVDHQHRKAAKIPSEIEEIVRDADRGDVEKFLHSSQSLNCTRLTGSTTDRGSGEPARVVAAPAVDLAVGAERKALQFKSRDGTI